MLNSMPCFLKAPIFHKISQKISYFGKKFQKFRTLWAMPPDPENQNPLLQISGYAPTTEA